MAGLPEGCTVEDLDKRLRDLFPEPNKPEVSPAQSPLDYWFDVPEPYSGLKDATALAVGGRAQVGSLEHVCRELFQAGFNIVGAAASVLHGYWSSVFAVTATDVRQQEERLDEVRQRLGFGLTAELFSTPGAASYDVSGVDRYNVCMEVGRTEAFPKVAKFFAKRDWNIESLYADFIGTARVNPGTTRFIVAPSSDVTEDQLDDELVNFTEAQGWPRPTVKKNRM